MAIQEEDFVDFETAIAAIPEGATEVNIRGARLDEEVVKGLAAALTSSNDKVSWTFTHANNADFPDDPDAVVFTKEVIKPIDPDEEMPDVRCGYVRSNLANITSITIQIHEERKVVSFGLTSDPGDEDDFAHGFGIKLAKDGLRKAAVHDGLLEDYEYNAMLDTFCICINDGAVEFHKNGRLLKAMGSTSAGSMHALICICDSKQKAQVMGTTTVTCVSSIDLNGCNIGDKGLALLAPALSLNPIAAIDLGLNGINDEGVTSLAEALKSDRNRLTSLNLSHNGIKDLGIVRLSKALVLPSCLVSSLDLTDNGIGDEGAMNLALAIKQDSCSLTKLKLSLNAIGHDGAVAIAEALESDACKVEAIDMAYNKPGPGKAGTKRLAQAFASTMRLNVA